MMKTLLLLVLLAAPMRAAEVLPSGFTRGANGDLVIGGTITVTQMLVVNGGQTMTLSTGGFDTTGTVMFSSNVVIAGDMEVRSSKQKAIYLPNGGIHLSTDTNVNTAPGQMFSKQLVTSTLTFKGSAILWKDANNTIVSSMTETQLSIGIVNTSTIAATSVSASTMTTGVISGKVRNTNTGGGAPAAGDCNSGTLGTFYENTAQPKLYYCRNDSTWGVITMTAAP